MIRNRLNLSEAIDIVSNEYETRGLSGDPYSILHELMSNGSLDTYIELPPNFGVMPRIPKDHWGLFTSVQFNAMFEFEDDERSILLVDRDNYSEEILNAITPDDFTAEGESIVELLSRYMSLVPKNVEIFVYEDELLRLFASLPNTSNSSSGKENKKSGAPEKDRGWSYMIASFFIEKFLAAHRREPTDDEVISFFNDNKDQTDSSRAQISDETLRRELAELKRRRGTLVERFKNKYSEE